MQQLATESSDKNNPQIKFTNPNTVSILNEINVNSLFTLLFYFYSRSSIREDVSIGTTILKLTPDLINVYNDQNVSFEIITGNEDEIFDVIYPSNAIILVRQLDRENTEHYNLRLVLTEKGIRGSHDDNSTAINVVVIVEDANDNAPLFEPAEYETTISEATPLKQKVAQVVAIDKDLENSPNSEVVYDITSGNVGGMFSIDLISGIISVNNDLDYDGTVSEFNLIVRACDSADRPKCSLQPYLVYLTDENDNQPKFPVAEYLEFVGENEPVGVSVFTARASDLDKGKYGNLTYSIISTAGSYSETAESTNLFNVDAITGIVTCNSILDYEQRSLYTFSLKATDLGGKSATVKVRIFVDSRDEFTPQFTERTYRFTLSTTATHTLQSGYVIGHVSATDSDKGPDGRVIYQLTTQHPYFKINRTTGAIVVKKKLGGSAMSLESGRDISLVVTASSGRQGSLTNMTVVEIALDPLAHPGTNQASTINNSTDSGIADWALGLLISLILVVLTFAAVFLFLHFKSRRHKHVSKPRLSAETVGNSNSYVDQSAFDTIPIRGNTGGVANAGQFAPPKYDEIPPYGPHGAAGSNSGAATTSELSGSEQSGSSGRGSAEDGDDGEDEEIRMINEGNLQRDNALHRSNEDGRLSDVSVHNTQEYLARLGIIDNPNTTGGASTSSRRCSDSINGSNKDTMLHHAMPMHSLHMFDEEPSENDITNLIYAKLNDVTGGGSDRASSTDEGGTTAGSIGTAVDHVMVMGGFSDHHPVVNSSGNPGPSMNGSLSSIVHSEEELTGSYNWDYLLDWGPQYQPLAHVFSEIARLKDDTMSVHSSGASSAKSKISLRPAKHIPPPLLTNVAPRSVPVMSSRNNLGHHSSSVNQYHLPRSPISHDTPGSFCTSSAMSPSFSPSMSPLATRSPSISPHIIAANVPASLHMVSLPRQHPMPTQRKKVHDPEMRVRK